MPILQILTLTTGALQMSHRVHFIIDVIQVKKYPCKGKVAFCLFMIFYFGLFGLIFLTDSLIWLRCCFHFIQDNWMKENPRLEQVRQMSPLFKLKCSSVTGVKQAGGTNKGQKN